MNLTGHFAREGRSNVALSVVRARRGQGFDGRPLARLADGSVAGPNMARRLAGGAVVPSADGFEVRYDDVPLELFDRGTKHQPERRVIGLADDARDAITARTTREVARQLQARVRRGA